jgi:uncharacterized membrane protein
MLPTKFRRQLRREADLWAQEGLIDRTTHDRLAQRYQFSALDVESRNSLITLLIGLGCVLIGIGVLTFVSANWQQLAREWRVGILLGAFIAVNLLGFYLWRKPAGGKHRFGQGLLLLGALMLGGNMALMGQMFHVKGDLFQLLIAWAVGVLLMAYSLRMTSLGILAQILMGIGYWQAYTSGFWSSERVDIDPNWTYFVFQHMPIVAICLFLPLAYWCRSQAIFTLTGIAFLSSFSSILPSGQGGITFIDALLLLCVPSLVPLLLWGYGNLSQWWQGDRRDKTGAFGKISRSLAVLVLGVTYFALSFIPFRTTYSSSETINTLSSADVNWNLSSVYWDLGIVTVVTIIIWLYLIWQSHHRSRHYPWDRTTTGISFVSCILPVTIYLPVLTPAIFWVLLFAITVGLIRSGLANSDRGTFWFGLGLLSSRIIIWFLMTQNDLMTKSLLFILFGVGIIAVGLWFERYVRRLSEAKIN